MANVQELINRLVYEFYSSLNDADRLDKEKAKYIREIKKARMKWLRKKRYKRFLKNKQKPFIEDIEFRMNQFVLNKGRIKRILERDNKNYNSYYFNVVERIIDSIHPIIREIHNLTDRQIDADSLDEYMEVYGEETKKLGRIRQIIIEQGINSDKIRQIKRRHAFRKMTRMLRENKKPAFVAIGIAIIIPLMLISLDTTAHHYETNKMNTQEERMMDEETTLVVEQKKKTEKVYVPKVEPFSGKIKIKKVKLPELHNHGPKEDPVIVPYDQAMKKEKFSVLNLSRDEDIIARTIYDEARGESVKGRELVGSVIFNRGDGNPAKMRETCLEKNQFSGWNDGHCPRGSGKVWEHCKRLAVKMCREKYNPDNRGFYYFYNPNKVSKTPSFAYKWEKEPIPGKPGAWKWKETNKKREGEKVGDHLFLTKHA